MSAIPFSADPAASPPTVIDDKVAYLLAAKNPHRPGTKRAEAFERKREKMRDRLKREAAIAAAKQELVDARAAATAASFAPMPSIYSQWGAVRTRAYIVARNRVASVSTRVRITAQELRAAVATLHAVETMPIAQCADLAAEG